ncbi:hypothetical protein [Lacticaseibacillus suibinensis]|uniref:hypothetical protein n=1 Tax=Lacticaseibacillus suibinensis TaxID=2486011 RepID=UPI0019419B44|nr:hypothetical protein [Lacticaseibacillus suibinensis]
MGERTQLSVAVVRDDLELCRVSIHYQWGYGRVMLMDALHIGWSLEFRPWWHHTADEAEQVAQDIIGYAAGVENFVEWDNRYHENLTEMFKWSDNNDGFAELTVPLSEDTVKGLELRLYDHAGTACTLAEYVQRSESGEYADSAFRHHFKALLADIGVELIEKAGVVA